MATAKDIYRCLDTLMPFDRQESWDNSGLLVDNGDTDITKVLVCLDVTAEAAKAAVAQGCKLILSHHPVIFSPILKLATDSVVARLIKNDIAVLSAHTNFDKYQYGTSYILKEFLQLKGKTQSAEIGVIVELQQEMEALALLEQIKRRVKNTIEYTAGKNTVRRIFVIAGSGKGMIEDIVQSGADCVITGESGYHDQLYLKAMGITTICISHQLSESVAIEPLCNIIKEHFQNIQVLPFVEEPITRLY